MHRKTKKHYFNKDCCRIIKLRGSAAFEQLGLRKQNLNGMSTNIRRKEDFEITNQKRTYYKHSKGVTERQYSDNQQINNRTPSKNDTFKQSFGQTQVQVISEVNSNKQTKFLQKLDDQDKENNLNSSEQKQNQNKLLNQTTWQQSQYLPMNQPLTDINQALPHIMQMLFDIKNQNLYLIERNIELEQVINGDIKPTIEEGFYEVKTELKEIKSQINQNSKDQKIINKKFKQMQFSYRYRENFGFAFKKQRKFKYTQKNHIMQESQEQEVKSEPLILYKQDEVSSDQVNQIGMATDSTLIRKLEETVQIPQDPSQDGMRFSVGANLLELMAQGSNKNNGNSQQNPSQKKNGIRSGARRGIRNFNFRCNLNEIDKIIEEENCNDNPNGESSNCQNSNTTSPLNKNDINNQIRNCQKQEELDCGKFEMTAQYISNIKEFQSDEKQACITQEMTRPFISQHKENPVRQRKMWGVQNRPQTGNVQRIVSANLGNKNDNILSLLSQDNNDETLQLISKTEIIGNSNHNSDEFSSKTQDTAMKIEELKTNQKDINNFKGKRPQFSQRNQINAKRGMFKAPQMDIESLLNDEATQETNNIIQDQQLKIKTPVKKVSDNSQIIHPDKQAIINNFMTEQSDKKSRSRSRAQNLQNVDNESNKKPKFAGVAGFRQKGLINQQMFNLQMIDSDGEDENQKQSKGQLDDNPFQNDNTLMNLEIQKAKNLNKGDKNDKNVKKRGIIRPAKSGIPSIEDLLNGVKHQDQDQVDNEDQNYSNTSSDQFTESEKNSLFFINKGKQNNDDTADFGSL